MDTSIKQQLWIVFQQESFLPNDTRVSTRRISEHGVRAAIRSLASMLERVFSSVVPAPAAALLVKMEELVNRDLFVQTAWKQMCQASVVATVNWTGFCGVLLAMLVDLPKMAAAAMATDDDYAQVLVQKQRKAPLSVTTSSPSASSLRRQVDPHPVEMFQASVAQPVAVGLPRQQVEDEVVQLRLSPVKAADGMSSISAPSPFLASSASDAVVASVPAVPLMEPSGPGGSKRPVQTALSSSQQASATASRSTSAATSVVTAPATDIQSRHQPPAGIGMKRMDEVLTNSVGMPVMMKAPGTALPQRSSPPSRPKRTVSPSDSTRPFVLAAGLDAPTFSPAPAVRSTTPTKATSSAHIDPHLERTMGGPASHLKHRPAVTQVIDFAASPAATKQLQLAAPQAESVLRGGADTGELYDARYNKTVNERVRAARGGVVGSHSRPDESVGRSSCSSSPDGPSGVTAADIIYRNSNHPDRQYGRHEVNERLTRDAHPEARWPQNHQRAEDSFIAATRRESSFMDVTPKADALQSQHRRPSSAVPFTMDDGATDFQPPQMSSHRQAPPSTRGACCVASQSQQNRSNSDRLAALKALSDELYAIPSRGSSNNTSSRRRTGSPVVTIDASSWKSCAAPDTSETSRPAFWPQQQPQPNSPSNSMAMKPKEIEVKSQQQKNLQQHSNGSEDTFNANSCPLRETVVSPSRSAILKGPIGGGEEAKENHHPLIVSAALRLAEPLGTDKWPDPVRTKPLASAKPLLSSTAVSVPPAQSQSLPKTAPPRTSPKSASPSPPATVSVTVQELFPERSISGNSITVPRTRAPPKRLSPPNAALSMPNPPAALPLRAQHA